MNQLKPCDVVFFSGALPYYFSKKEREQLPVPTLYLAQDELTISSSLLAAIYHKQVSFDRISILLDHRHENAEWLCNLDVAAPSPSRS